MQSFLIFKNRLVNKKLDIDVDIDDNVKTDLDTTSYITAKKSLYTHFHHGPGQLGRKVDGLHRSVIILNII